MNILVTAGPTHEYMDDVRYLSNRSSGKMGYLIAQALHRRGHSVYLVSGPTHLKPPTGVIYIPVTSATEMKQQTQKRFARMNGAVLCAAVSDYRPKKRVKGKIKKGKGNQTLRLIQNEDIAASLGRKKGKRLLVGFALETDHMGKNAVSKLHQKHFDHIVLNSPASFQADIADFILIHKNHKATLHRQISKRAFSTIIAKLFDPKS